LKYILLIVLVMITQACANYSMIKRADAVQAKFNIKEAHEVYLYTSVNGYKKIRLDNDKDKWSGAFPFKEEFRYFLTVDGKTYLPDCKAKESDGFGGELCIYEEN